MLNNLNYIGVINLNESTACRCSCMHASVEMPKLHNLKLIHIYNYYAVHMMNINLHAACKLKEWVMIDHVCC